MLQIDAMGTEHDNNIGCTGVNTLMVTRHIDINQVLGNFKGVLRGYSVVRKKSVE